MSVLIALFSFGLINGGPTGATAKAVNNTTLGLMQGLRLLPRTDNLGYLENAAGNKIDIRVPLNDDHFLVEQARSYMGTNSPISGWMTVNLPSELAAKYRGMWAYVPEVVDGDTFFISNGRGVRPLGINTPETDHGPGFKAVSYTHLTLPTTHPV